MRLGGRDLPFDRRSRPGSWPRRAEFDRRRACISIATSRIDAWNLDERRARWRIRGGDVHDAEERRGREQPCWDVAGGIARRSRRGDGVAERGLGFVRTRTNVHGDGSRGPRPAERRDHPARPAESSRTGGQPTNARRLLAKRCRNSERSRDASFESSSNALAFGSHEPTRADSARPPHRETRQRLAGRYLRSESAKRSPPASGPREAIVSVRRSRCSPRCATRSAPACPAPAAPGRDSCGRRGRCSSPRCSR